MLFFVYQGGWCASSSDQDFTPWIQVNFNARVTITGLVTQGMWNFNNRVSTYNVKYGDFASSLTYVTTSSGSVQLVSTEIWVILIKYIVT